VPNLRDMTKEYESGVVSQSNSSNDRFFWEILSKILKNGFFGFDVKRKIFFEESELLGKLWSLFYYLSGIVDTIGR